MNSLASKMAMQVADGDIILRHPDHPEQSGEWTVQAHRAGEYREFIDYTDADGKDGQFVVSIERRLLVRLPEHLTPSERSAMYEGLDESEFWGFVAHVKNNFPAVFDSAAAYIGRVRAEDAAAVR